MTQAETLFSFALIRTTIAKIRYVRRGYVYTQHRMVLPNQQIYIPRQLGTTAYRMRCQTHRVKRALILTFMTKIR
jgi:hypothetical protein